MTIIKMVRLGFILGFLLVGAGCASSPTEYTGGGAIAGGLLGGLVTKVVCKDCSSEAVGLGVVVGALAGDSVEAEGVMVNRARQANAEVRAFNNRFCPGLTGPALKGCRTGALQNIEANRQYEAAQAELIADQQRRRDAKIERQACIAALGTNC